MSNYLATDTDLIAVANAIRVKGGTSSSLSFPNGYVSAIQDIQTGITVVESLDPSGGTIVNITGDPVTALQTKTITPTSSTQTVVPDTGYSGLTSVIVNGDSNLVSSNIANGVSIFGVTGTYQGIGWEKTSEEQVEKLIDRTISGSVYGSMVLNLRSGAFADCINLKAASFPNCTNICMGAFSNCSSLTTISFPECAYIAFAAFYSCYNLDNVFFPKCLSIENYAFSTCYSLTTISFPRCYIIGASAFWGCNNLTSVFFPKCTSINGYAFCSCTNLTAVSFPECTYIGQNAFANCQNLSSVFIPRCTQILMTAFQSCYKLATISIPKCNNISASAFKDCRSLKSVYILTSSVPTLASYVFSSTPITSTSYLGYYGSIYVLSSMLNSFKAATNWSLIANRIVAY